MSEETITLNIEVKAVLNIDREKWPKDWNLWKEVGHQLSFDDARTWTILGISQEQKQPSVAEGFMEE